MMDDSNKKDEDIKNNKLHQFAYNLNNYDIPQHTSEQFDKSNVAEYINKYYNNMTVEEMKYFLPKCIDENEMRRIILGYELKFFTITPIKMSLKTFARETQKILLRYQHKAGGFCFDDHIWKMYDCTSTKYHLNETELLFENTIHEDFVRDSECSNYLLMLINKLNMLSTNIKVSIHSNYLKRDQIYCIVLKCKVK